MPSVYARAHTKTPSQFHAAVYLVVALALAVMSLTAVAPSARGDTTAHLWTTYDDYRPESTVDINGSGFVPGQVYAMPVKRPNGDIVTVDPEHNFSATPGFQTATADANGNLRYDYQLDGVLGLYEARAYALPWDTTKWSQTPFASVTFTDAPGASANLDQCANGDITKPTDPVCDTAHPGEWINGNMGQSKAHYLEGDSLPYRMVMGGLGTDATVEHTITLEFDTLKGGAHAIDYATTYNRTVANADPCTGALPAAQCNTALATTYSTFSIAKDPYNKPNAGAAESGTNPSFQIAGDFTLFGKAATGSAKATITSVVGPTRDSSDADQPVSYQIKFKSPIANPVLAWGGHIATRADWKTVTDGRSPLAAVNISGSPYHTRLIEVDDNGGSQDRSLSTEAVIFPGSITIKKTTNFETTDTFGFTAGPTPLSNFSLPSGGSKPFTNILNFQDYTVTENAAGDWKPTITCEVVNANGGTQTILTSGQVQTGVKIGLKEGEDVTCTFANEFVGIFGSTLNVVKRVVNDDGGTAVPGDFTMHVAGTNPNPAQFPGVNDVLPNAGTPVDIDPGAYTVSEDPVSGYTATFSGDCDAQGKGNLPDRATQTCIVTNDDVAPHLTVVKELDPATDPGKFDLKIGDTVYATAVGDGGSTPAVKLQANVEYQVGEAAGNTDTHLSDYAVTYGGDCDENGKVTLEPGQDATCTIHNSRVTGKLVVKKHVVNDDGGSAVAKNWNLTVKQGTSTVGGPAEGSETGAEYTLNTGTYTVSEAGGPDGYALSFADSCNASGEVTVTAGATVVCTLVNDDIAPSLKVIKHVVNDNGGSAVAGDSHWTVTGNTPNPATGAGVEGPGGTNVTIKAGAYNVTEDTGGPAGYAVSYSAGCSGTLALDDDAVCTITNDDLAPGLTVIKHVVNDNGGAATADQFHWTVTGNTPNPASGAGAENPGTNVTIKAGAYNVTEDTGGPAGYAVSYEGCSGTLALDQKATCTITNDDIAPQLTVIKKVVNAHGGKATSASFTMNVTATNPSDDSFPGADGTGTTITLNAGSYSVTEAGPAGYSPESTSDCIGTIALNEKKTCIFTNTDIAPQLKVIKHVVNDNGGTKAAGDFTMNVTATNPSDDSFPGVEGPDGTVITLDAGTFSVDETGPAGYTKTSAVGCTGTAVIGQLAVCTITNNDDAPKIRVIKTVINDNGGTKTAFPITVGPSSLSPSPANFTGQPGPTGTLVTLNAGSYNVTEVEDPAYAATYSSECTGTIKVGDAIPTCTITNNDVPPKLTVIKKVVTTQPSDPGKFNLYVKSGTTTVASVLNVGNDGKIDQATLNAGNYTVSEAAGTATNLSDYVSVISGDCSSTGAVTLALAQSKTCTITNTAKAKATVIKTVNGSTTGWTTQYNFTLTGGPDNVNLSGTTWLNGNTNTINFGTLAPGTYTFCENGVPGGTTSGIVMNKTLYPTGTNISTGTQTNACSTVTLAPGETKTFTVDNFIPLNGQRTIGYWKNWNTCSNSPQAKNAAKTGNKLLDQFLPFSFANNNPFVPKGGVNPNYPGLEVTTCAKAVEILSTASAKAAEHALATQLMAAMLNQANAKACPAGVDAIKAGQKLLQDIQWNGSPTSNIVTDKSAVTLRAQFTAAAAQLDKFNNEKLC